MSLPTVYDDGTASIANGATTVTGTGTFWSGTITSGDIFHDPAQGLVMRIESVTDYDELELAHPWPGTSLTGDDYEIWYTPDSVRSSERNRQLIEQMSVVEANGRGLFYTFSSTTTDSDPGGGVLRLNNATASSATAAYLDNLDANGATVSAVLDTWDDSTSTTRGQLWIRSIASPANFRAYNVTGSVVDGTGYRKLTLTYVGGSGGFSDADELMVAFAPTGDVATGALLAAGGTMSGVLLLDDSTNVTTAPVLAFDGDPNTGLGHSAADTLSLVTGGTERLKIDSSGRQTLPNQPAFMAYSATAQSVSNGLTKVTLGTESFDNGGNFASSRFTAPIAGKYVFFGQVTFADGTADTGSYGMAFYKNGVLFFDQYRSKHGFFECFTMQMVMSLAASDYVELYAGLDSASGSPTLASGRSFLSGYLLG